MNKIKVGFFSITEADDDEAHVAWHQLDHMCEQFRIPGLSWGQRFFATPACVAASLGLPTTLEPPSRRAELPRARSAVRNWNRVTGTRAA